MKTDSLWQETKTFFPLVEQLIADRGITRVAVVGASDGKFVLPLARRGIQVVAVECSPLALYGGPVTLPGGEAGEMLGLHKRLAEEGLTGSVTVVEQNVLDMQRTGIPPVQLVWTSCSWHYSLNHTRPLDDFIDQMVGLLEPAGGLFVAEYMMPLTPKAVRVKHYLNAGEIHRYLPDDAEVLWEAYTPPFIEAPHVEQLEPHTHQMGFIAAHLP